MLALLQVLRTGKDTHRVQTNKARRLPYTRPGPQPGPAKGKDKVHLYNATFWHLLQVALSSQTGADVLAQAAVQARAHGL